MGKEYYGNFSTGYTVLPNAEGRLPGHETTASYKANPARIPATGQVLWLTCTAFLPIIGIAMIMKFALSNLSGTITGGNMQLAADNDMPCRQAACEERGKRRGTALREQTAEIIRNKCLAGSQPKGGPLSTGGNMTVRKSHMFMLAVLVVLLTFSFSEAKLSDTDEACLGCHQMDQTLKFGNGETLSLKVNPAEVEKSVHRIIGCSTCHGFTSDNHPQRSYKSRKEFTSLSARKCRQCHDTKENTIHEKLIRESATNTTCTDCHGAHAVKRVRELSKGNQYCLTCHNKELEVHYKDGHKEMAMVDEAVLNKSVHKNLSCVDCHVMVSAEEHPVRQFQNKRDFSIVMAENCRRCHFDKYSRTLEGVHFKQLIEGNANAPICSDCHGTHAIASARKDKLANAQKCEKCHRDVYAIYAKSVHGAALIKENIEDVPICSDCHKAHDNAGPRTANFRISVPQICASCHANKEVMQKYGLSTKVIDTYLQDFHGVTMKFYRQYGQTEKQIAVCIDCHGVHDIARVKNQNAAVVKQHLLKRCQKCHADATANFPDSWVSHYEPNIKKAPMVYLVDLGYKIFIPFMIIGLLLQIVLHLWRYAVNR